MKKKLVKAVHVQEVCIKQANNISSSIVLRTMKGVHYTLEKEQLAAKSLQFTLNCNDFKIIRNIMEDKLYGKH